MRERDDEWTGLMRSAIAGDSAAYHRLLKAVTPVLRAAARRGLARSGQPVDQSEDIVQDILLAVHLKRHTWDVSAPFAPWLFAIARNKLIDALRRRGRRIFVDIDDFAETLAGEPAPEIAPAGEVAAQLQALPARQREVLQSIAVESAEEYFTLMGSAFEDFRRTTAVQTDGGFLEGEGIGPIRPDLPEFGVIRERAFVRGR